MGWIGAHTLSGMITRRSLLLAAPTLPWPLASRATDDGAALAALRAGGVVVAFRHALAPGTFDPPQFRLGDCSTQRNLNEEGRAQARRIGAWFRGHGLQPAAVRSSPWCRCIDTATLAFGGAEAWPALGSPRGSDAATNAARIASLRERLAVAGRAAGRFEVWVTHMFVQSDLVGGGAGSGEGLVLRADASGAPQVLARLNIG